MTLAGTLPNRPDARPTTPAHEPLPTDSMAQMMGPPRRRESASPSDQHHPTDLLPATTSLFCRHDHGGNKTLNWSLSPTRPVLIVGASNMGRLPLVLDPEVQVDCFPGARVSHALHLLRHRTPSPQGLDWWYYTLDSMTARPKTSPY